MASEALLQALRNSFKITSRASLFRAGELILADLPILSGEVTDDASAIIRRRCRVDLEPSTEILDLFGTSVPENTGLWPLGNELFIECGIHLPDGTVEYVNQGVYRISRPVLTETNEGLTISIDGYDRNRSMSRARFTGPYIVPHGTNYAEAIKTLVQSRIPTLTEEDFNFMTTNYVTPELIFAPDDDPAQVATNMAGSIGAEFFFDLDGKATLRPEPNPLYDPPVFEYEEGENCTMTTITRDLDDEQAYNGVIVSGENTDNDEPVRGVAWDTDPDSPTYFDPLFPERSIYGPVPYFLESQYITTDEQAQAAAEAQLLRVLGIVEKIDISAAPNPIHRSNDVISVKRSKLGVDSVYLLDSFRFGLGASEGFQGITRKRRAS